jgi:hypothetical protein
MANICRTSASKYTGGNILDFVKKKIDLLQKLYSNDDKLIIQLVLATLTKDLATVFREGIQYDTKMFLKIFEAYVNHNNALQEPIVQDPQSQRLNQAQTMSQKTFQSSADQPSLLNINDSIHEALTAFVQSASFTNGIQFDFQSC